MLLADIFLYKFKRKATSKMITPIEAIMSDVFMILLIQLTQSSGCFFHQAEY